MTIDTVYHATTILLGVGLAIKALETISLLPAYERHGVFDYSIAGSDSFLGSRLFPQISSLYSRTGVLILSAVSISSFLMLLFVDFGSLAFRALLLLLILPNVALYYRQAFGLDGADQMSLLILLSLLICFIPWADPEIQKVGIWFIGLQLSLSYLVSGVAKLASKEWRTGTAIPGILSTFTYGTRLTRRFFVKHRRLSLAVCWFVIAIEVLIPFGLFFGPQGALVVLGVGLMMHVSIAIIMGLNDFVWGFTAAYPSFYYLAATLH